MNTRYSAPLCILEYAVSSIQISLWAKNSWQPVAVPGQLNAIATDQLGIIIGTTTSYGVFRSADDGTSWQSLHTWTEMNNGLPVVTYGISTLVSRLISESPTSET